ncbi:MAG: VanZ family protein [Psychromonas sp.]|jgi:VanZ family protein|uniref:hypothetical protein n=1 Tax=Psychromonas sp. TaxID=1884585 RepID=UPI0039E26E7D
MFKKTLDLLITFILIILLFARVPVFISERLIDTLWPIGHIICFSFWGWLLISFSSYINKSTSKRQLVILLLITLIIGGGIELLQPFFSRTGQLGDLYHDLFGAFFAYLFFGNFNKNNMFLIASRFLYITLFFYLTFPAMQVIKDEYELHMDFPTIAKFDNPSELTRWKADLPLLMVNSNELSETRVADRTLMKVTFAAEMDSRAVLRFFAGDWQGYKQIKFSFFNPNQDPLKVRLIITDKIYNKSKPDPNDRFGKWLMIDSGWNEHKVALAEIKNSPKEREIDLGNIAGVDFYMYHLKEPIILYINKIELISRLD